MMSHQKTAILLVEDQTAVREIVADTLREFRLADRVETTDSLAGMRKSLLLTNWQAIITDMSLCDGNVLTLFEDAQWVNFSFPPVLLMSGYLSAIQITRAQDLGIRHILHKPFTPYQLIEMLQQML